MGPVVGPIPGIREVISISHREDLSVAMNIERTLMDSYES